MTKQEIKNLLQALGYATDLTMSVYTKTYNVCKKTLSVDVDNEKINYDKIGIKLGDKTTSNFSQDENFVVLECVNRLLDKGYEPQHLMLERKWPVGHGASGGKADINVFDREGKTLIIIECKTWGKEYEKYTQKMQNHGAQFFSYLQQDKNTKFLCLYASHLENNKIVYQTAIVNIRDRGETLRLLDEGQDVKTYKEAKTKEELYEVWNENFNCYFAPNGIFDEEVQAYNPEHIPIKRKDLQGFTENEGRKFYSQFLEILRHNNISDKSNAFNRIMSLILCKIVDERKDENEVTDFQIIEGKDTPESIQERLQNLYAKGMKDFLREEIVNYTEKDIDSIVSRFPRQKAQKEIKQILHALKYYSNNEFAFKEVHNEKLFLENAKVLNEILTLLQYKKFRYSYSDNGDAKFQKQYLGNFFELLLDSGYKQDEGQYFTPIPIAKFIVWSLPIKEIIEKKLRQKNAKFLPYVMDYACGSGHFLTEVIEEIQHIISELKPEYDKATNKEIDFKKSNTIWTEEYIYGIEKDYRLARTSKVACFMHGDGEATIVFGDGLEDYNEKDKTLAPAYDLIVANPPYSVHGFKPHIQKLGDKYSLYEHLTDSSSEIEALFVERTAQLLNKDGIAGIILPGSILNSNTTIYTKTRELILQNFEIKAIVECGSETFLATETQTIILFLQRRDDRWKEDYRYVAEDFILHNKKRKDDFADTESLFKAYTENIELEFDDYKTLPARKPNDSLKQTEWFRDYENWFYKLTEIKNLKKGNAFKQLKAEKKKEKLEKLFYNKVLELEKEKFYYFLLANGQQTLIVKTGTGKEEQRNFLGYEKKKGKRDAGLKMYLEEGKHITMLYDEVDKFNEEKANTHINKLLSGSQLKIEGELENHLVYKNLVDCIDFSTINFELQILISGQNRIDYQSFWNVPNKKLNRLKDVCEFAKGTSITKSQITKGKYPVIAGGKKPAYYHNKFNFEGDNITVSASGTAGYVMYHTDRIFASDCSIIKSKDHNSVRTKTIYLMLKLMQDELYKLQRGAIQPHVYISDLEKIKIPDLTNKQQDAFLKEIEKLEQEEKDFRELTDEYNHEIKTLVTTTYTTNYNSVVLGAICTNIQYGISQKMNIIAKGYKIFRMNEIVNNRMFDGGAMKCVDIPEVEFVKYKLNNGDILFNRTNSFELVGKTGIFDLDGDYCFASYLIRIVVDAAKANPWFVNLMMNSENFQ
ncbi:MAG: N-6 DNA methylase, partial [Bacteroidales bacterium]|nr:N-6 DNA methylase [Bacteroidales bacterium]